MEVEGVRVSYGAGRSEVREVLRGVSFGARAGEFVAVLGANGAGKSTLLDVMAGIREADAGRVVVRGRSDWTGNERARLVSHLPQTLDARLPFSAEQVVAMGRYPHTARNANLRDRWFESAEDRVQIELAMERTGCWGHRGRRFGSLSGGERQRVLLAACVAQDAGVMLLDEPSTFLDISAQLECFRLLRDEAAEGRLCVAVTHDLNLALTFCTRLVVLEGGVVARDFAAAGAGEDVSWLAGFSPELRMGTTGAGRPWVYYS